MRCHSPDFICTFRRAHSLYTICSKQLTPLARYAKLAMNASTWITIIDFHRGLNLNVS